MFARCIWSDGVMMRKILSEGFIYIENSKVNFYFKIYCISYSKFTVFLVQNLLYFLFKIYCISCIWHSTIRWKDVCFIYVWSGILYVMQCKWLLKWIQSNADLPSFRFVLNINVLYTKFIFKRLIYISFSAIFLFGI